MYMKIVVLRYCRENFLKIHLFYGDISYNSLNQSRAYDPETLLSTFCRRYEIFIAHPHTKLHRALYCLSVGLTSCTFVQRPPVLFQNASLKIFRLCIFIIVVL